MRPEIYLEPIARNLQILKVTRRQGRDLRPIVFWDHLLMTLITHASAFCTVHCTYKGKLK